jgi:hypothetical protein
MSDEEPETETVLSTSDDGKREIILLNCDEIGVSLVLWYAFREFADAFVRDGHLVRTVTTLSDLSTIRKDPPALIFMGNAVPVFSMANVCHRLATHAPEATFVGCYWQDHCAAIESAGLKFLHIHENMLHPQPPLAPQMTRMLTLVPPDARCPFLLRANDAVDAIGQYDRRPERDYCYMGWRYPECDDLVPCCFDQQESRYSAAIAPFRGYTGIYYAVNDHTKYLSYDQRRQLYLTSHFALGFQGFENIENGHVSQRIYEGLAYGCVVLTNSWAAHEQTNRIAEFVSCRADVERKMRYFLDHPDLMAHKQQAGYAFVRQQGTNDYARMQILRAEAKVLQQHHAPR